MAAENSSKSKLKTYTSTRENTFTLVALQSFNFSDVLLYIRLTMKNLIGREHSINSQ